MGKIKHRSIFSQNVIARRGALGMSQEAFADLAGIGVSALRNIERGSSAGQPKTKQAIARALGCTIQDLLKDPKDNNLTLSAVELSPEESLRAELLLLVSSLSESELRDASTVFKRLFPKRD